ncbi:PP2C family protein-serine/threonine phosphatase [Vibrio lentus]|uniref:PP2C family protein-serine/threonine phosphatase n=1 Tax=Vibrio lentus TaxID=136468 RepID=UPI003D14EA97
MDMINILESSSFCLAKNSNKENQDSILPAKTIDGGVLFCVADGVGSYNGSKLASQRVVDLLNSMKKSGELTDFENIFSEARKIVSNLATIKEEYRQAATTLTFGYLNSQGLYIGHIGDCRLYVRNGFKLEQLTKDHTQYQSLLDEKLFTKKELQSQKEKAQSILTTAISQFVEMNFDSIFIPMEQLPKDNGTISLFVMSDGTYKFWDKRPRFSDKTMTNISYFTSSLKRRVERTAPVDDYSMVAISVKLP